MGQRSPAHRTTLGKAILEHLATRTEFVTCRDEQLGEICKANYTGMLPPSKRLGTVLSELFAEGFLRRRSFKDVGNEVHIAYRRQSRKIFGYKVKK
ncbi:hypothetical protein pD_gene0059 [Vibrio phage 033B]|nr:hypothetical protein pD_gene0059 [Vibrio phage 033B]